MKKLLISLTLISSLYADKIDSELKCLAENIYFEARGSSLEDKFAVADVVLNRVKSKRYPNTICGVVRQSKTSKWYKEVHNKIVPLKHQCQFSWYCDGKDDTPKNKKAWNEAENIAGYIYYLGKNRGLTKGSTHYHAHYVNPKWAKKLVLMEEIGSHKYYKRDN